MDRVRTHATYLVRNVFPIATTTDFPRWPSYKSVLWSIVFFLGLQTTAKADLAIPQCAGGSFGDECSLSELAPVPYNPVSFDAYGASFAFDNTNALDPAHIKVSINRMGNSVTVNFQRYDATGNAIPLVSLNAPGVRPSFQYDVLWSIRPLDGRYISGASLTAGLLAGGQGRASNLSFVSDPAAPHGGSFFQLRDLTCSIYFPDCGILVSSDFSLDARYYQGFFASDSWTVDTFSKNPLDDQASVYYSTFEFELVPEPPSISLLVTALLGIGFTLRRRQQRATAAM